MMGYDYQVILSIPRYKSHPVFSQIPTDVSHVKSYFIANVIFNASCNYILSPENTFGTWSTSYILI